MDELPFEVAFITTPCPACAYPLDVQLRDVRIQARIFCPNCKRAVHLVDAEASTHGALEEAADAFQRIRRSIENVNRR